MVRQSNNRKAVFKYQMSSPTMYFGLDICFWSPLIRKGVIISSAHSFSSKPQIILDQYTSPTY